MRILLVEDDAVLREVIRRSLEDAGNVVDVASTVADAHYLWSIQSFDAVVLDLNLPDGSGLTALRAARARDERIAGLDAGADDYLGKPFELAELAARLRALSRRVHFADVVAEAGSLRLERASGRVYKVGAVHAARERAQ